MKVDNGCSCEMLKQKKYYANNVTIDEFAIDFKSALQGCKLVVDPLVQRIEIKMKEGFNLL